MKSLLLSLVLLASTAAFAGQVELGKYRATDKDTKTIVADFELKADASLTFSVKTPDLQKPITCVGTYKVQANTFSADLKCATDLLPQAAVKIDITNVNPQSIRTESGVEVAVVIDALGEEANTFLLKKAD